MYVAQGVFYGLPYVHFVTACSMGERKIKLTRGDTQIF